MKMITLELVKDKDCGNLGISVLGVGVGASDNEDEKLAIFIKAVTPGGLAETDGRMKVGIVIVNPEFTLKSIIFAFSF